MTTQPGWYPDPQNPAVMRYWDGTKWTQHTQAAQPVPFQGQPPTKSHVKSNLKALGAVAAVVIVALLAVTGVDTILNDDRAPERSQQQEAASTQQDLQSDPTLRDSATYVEVSQRDLEVILKDMRAHNGQRIILYGTVSQFDSATGPGRFLANVGTSTLGVGNYESAHLVGDPATLKPFVENDEVKMFVVVDGEYSYTSTADFKLTVPQFQIGIIEMAGS